MKNDDEPSMKTYRHSGMLGAAAATVLVCANTIAKTSAQTAVDTPMSVAEMAKAIARTIDANTAKSADGPLIFQSAIAHDNVVEIQYVAKDATFFARNKTNLNDTRLGLTRYYCHSSRVSFLNSGVIVHTVMLAPDNRDRTEITIDRASCASLPSAPKLADPESLARMAEGIAKRENAEKSASTKKGPFQFEAASARNSVVELRHVVTDTSVGQNLKEQPTQMIGVLKGYFCSKYDNDIARGLSINEKFTFADGSPIVDFMIDKSSCGL